MDNGHLSKNKKFSEFKENQMDNLLAHTEKEERINRKREKLENEEKLYLEEKQKKLLKQKKHA